MKLGLFLLFSIFFYWKVVFLPHAIILSVYLISYKWISVVCHIFFCVSLKVLVYQFSFPTALRIWCNSDLHGLVRSSPSRSPWSQQLTKKSFTDPKSFFVILLFGDSRTWYVYSGRISVLELRVKTMSLRWQELSLADLFKERSSKHFLMERKADEAVNSPTAMLF